MADYKFLVIDYDDKTFVSHVSLKRGAANAICREMYMEVADLFSAPESIDPNIRAIVLSGHGKHFCAGNDLDELISMTPENGVERMWRNGQAFFAIQECPVPVIAAVRGAALGAGLCIAASCDVIVASENARFGMPELTVGLPGGARQLARLAPQGLVRRMFLTGEPVSAKDLANWTGAIVACEDEDLLPRAQGIAEKIASYSPTAVRLSKQLLNQVEHMDVKAGYTYEQGFIAAMTGHPDAKEALNALQEKRAPKFERANLKGLKA